MDYPQLEAMLGAIVFGPETEQPDCLQYTIHKLRQAAALLEYRYAVEMQFAAQHQVATADAYEGQQNQPAPERPKRPRGRPAKTANGSAAHDAPPPTTGEPLFQTADSALAP